MKAWKAMVVAVVCGLVAGCAFLNPEPTTSGSRPGEKLKALPKPDPSKVKTATVYEIKNKAGFVHGLRMTRGMTDMLITGLVKSRHFQVVERERLNEIMREKALIRGGEATGDADSQKIKGASLIFAGAVTEMDQKGGGALGLGHWGVRVGAEMWVAQVGMDIRVIDAATSAVIDSIDVRREVRKVGLSGGHRWGVAGNVKISNALDLAVREVIDESIRLIVEKYGAR